MSEVEESPTMSVEDLEEEIPICVEDEEYFEDIQDIYDQLYVQFLKQQENLTSISGQLLETSSESKHMHASSSNGPHGRVHTSGEKRASPPLIIRPNPSFKKEKQVLVIKEDLEKLTISAKLEAPGASNKVMVSKK
ncbi:unnamed protein product [Ilex paraguariensis]|uniref:Uncharacterized protein n=1 Tax=Ilex paraguariensis TaxID=185542 RepID=A0ABC8TXV2_9AQUA